MNKQELIFKLRQLSALNGDKEISHQEADRSLLLFIDDKEISDAFNAVPK